MKKILLLILLVLASFQGFSQTPGISYQAVILNPKGKELPGVNSQTSILSNSRVAVRFTILDETYSQEYQEYHITNTDAYGMINLLIGHGNRIGSSYFQDILWNGLSKKLNVGIDFSGAGNNYTFLSEQELTFMPQPALGQDAQAILANKADILAEVKRATDAESAIQADVDANAAASILADETLQGNIDDLRLDVDANTIDIGNLTSAVNDINLEKANLESPSFTGTPLAPTAAAGTNTTQIATTAFVRNAIVTAETPDATTTEKGKMQLAGDLTGTASEPIIANAAIGTTKLAVGAVTTVKIADDAVTGDKLADGSVTEDKIGAAAITSSKINDGAVGTAKLADASVTTVKIADNAVTTAKINDGAIVSSKIESSPSFTGTPLAPTAAAGTNTTQIATTAFVTSAISTATASNDNFVTLNGAQTITGAKTFTSNIKLFAANWGNTALMNIGFAPSGENLTGISMGIDALRTHQYGQHVIAIGNEALYNDLRGVNNIGIGYRALYNSKDVNNDWGNRNVAIGSESGTNLIEGDNNTLIGTNTNTSISTISNSTAIGYQAVVNANNTIQLGNENITLVNTSGSITSGGVITGTSIVKVGGTSSQYLMADGSVSDGPAPVREVADEFSATASQTSFTLAQEPSVNSKVKMYINGIRISNTAYSVSGSTLTYVPANNGGYALSLGDRIQFDYYY